MSTTPDSLAVLSGGIDSLVVLATMLANGDRVDAISFLYGQRHSREIRAAKDICEHFDIRHDVIDLRGAFQGTSSLLEDSADEIPHGHYSDASMASTVVPARNMVFASVAASIAATRGARRIGIGVHAGDHPIYPDCRPAFVRAFEGAARLAVGIPGFSVFAPFLNDSKSEIVRAGNALSAPFHITWTCYEGGEKHCGRCGSCVERREAFQLAGVEDPTEWAEVEA